MKTTASSTTNQTAAVAEQAVQVAPTKATATRKASQKQAMPKAKSARKTAASKAAKASTKTGARKPAAKKTKIDAAIPREYSKRAVVVEMLHAKNGVTLDEIVAKTSWQRHTVRGLLSTLRSKSGLAIERFERDGGVHAYRIASK